MSTFAIETHDLVRVYKIKQTARGRAPSSVVALDGITLEVPFRGIFGLIGANGAGKTTLIRILVTLLLPSSGTARVVGFDVARQAQQVREHVALVSGSEYSGYGLLTVREQLWMFSQFYGIPSRIALERIDALLRSTGLYEERNRRVSTLSTGQRQKMNVIRGLIPDPQVLFFDEPTVGLDVAAARDVRAMIKEWVSTGPRRTILLTTHYMHEAENLCDCVAIIHRGRVLACDSPAVLKQHAVDGTYFVLTTDLLSDKSWLMHVPGVHRVDAGDMDNHTELRLRLEGDAAIANIAEALTTRRYRIHSLQKIEPTLEDAFIQVVGTRLGNV